MESKVGRGNAFYGREKRKAREKAAIKAESLSHVSDLKSDLKMNTSAEAEIYPRLNDRRMDKNEVGFCVSSES